MLAVVGTVPLLAALADLVRKPADLPLLTHLSVTANALGKQLAQFLFTLVFLPYEAYVSPDAIVRTLTRMLWTKKRLLEWKTSSDANRGQRHRLGRLLSDHVVRPGAGRRGDRCC